MSELIAVLVVIFAKGAAASIILNGVVDVAAARLRNHVWWKAVLAEANGGDDGK